MLLLTLGGCGAAESDPDVVRSDGGEVASPEPSIADEDSRPRILFLGTSLTAGYGLADPDSAFPARIQERVDAAGYPFRVENGGVSGDTSAGGLARLDWLLDGPLAVLVLELGANDGLRGLDVDAMDANLREIIRRTRERHPDVEIVLAGMEAPPNLGERYAGAFRGTFSRIARSEDTVLIPFLLDGVGGVPELNQDDQIHPTAEGHGVIAALVWDYLEPVLDSTDGGE